jgi:DNA-3-methyladenine glycosylase I
VKRCKWCESSDLYRKYHDEEWGVLVYDDRKLFEFIILESAQAGLSWITILKRREGYRNAFANFDPEFVAKFDEQNVAELMQDVGIIRNRLKIVATIKNAKAFLEIQKEYGSFSKFIWSYVGGKSIVNKFRSMNNIPATSELSIQISKDLKKRGFGFLGPTVMYAYLQAIGIVNDHVLDCFRYKEIV